MLNPGFIQLKSALNGWVSAQCLSAKERHSYRNKNLCISHNGMSHLKTEILSEVVEPNPRIPSTSVCTGNVCDFIVRAYTSRWRVVFGIIHGLELHA